jgi:DNA-binding NarL/FixJ family response regulator
MPLGFNLLSSRFKITLICHLCCCRARQLEVLRLIVEGYTNPEIAKSLYLSEHTVKTYVRGILNKLLVNDRVQAAVMALRLGLMS